MRSLRRSNEEILGCIGVRESGAGSLLDSYGGFVGRASKPLMRILSAMGVALSMRPLRLSWRSLSLEAEEKIPPLRARSPSL